MKPFGEGDLSLTGSKALEAHDAIEIEHSESTDPLLEKESMAVPRRKLMRFVKALILISILGLTFLLVQILFFKDGPFSLSPIRPSTFTIGGVVKLNLLDKTLSFTGSSTDEGLRMVFVGDVLQTPPDMDSCAKILGSPPGSGPGGINPFDRTICLKWKDTVLIVNDTQLSGSHCYMVNWATTSGTSTPKNCFVDMGHWYGGSLLRKQKWPLNDLEVSVNMQPFISAPLSEPSRGFGPVLERMWITSTGVGIIADSQDPLYVSVNADDIPAHFMCLKSQFKGSEYLFSEKNKLSLKYHVCLDRTAKLVHKQIMENFITLPNYGPSKALMRGPAWSTRGINMNNLTEKQALTLQVDIEKNNFPHSQLHIAGNFTRTVGNVYFDHARFPHSHQMVSEMHSHGFNVCTSILPFLEKNSELYSFSDGMEKGVFVNISQNQVFEFEWNKRWVALVDFTNPKACDWMASRLTEVKAEASIYAFHFDGGEAAWLSRFRKTAIPLPNHCDYSRFYVKFARSQGDNSIVSVGYRSQEFGLMVDIGARHSTWGYDLGLKSIIPSVFTLGIAGYPFVMVGPVGGIPSHSFEPEKNSYALPEEELYIRWLQLSVFLPGLDMSVGPWQYKKEVQDMALALLKRRAEQIFPMLQTATNEFLHTGAPLIRPLWWMAADDELSMRIDSEFLISNKLLVAPVLEKGASSRHIYLPKVKGFQWQDDLRGTSHEGGQWLTDYKVGLYEVPTFRPV